MAEVTDDERCPISEAWNIRHYECWYEGLECCGCNDIRPMSTVEDE
jgi:hypothetical protein